MAIELGPGVVLGAGVQIYAGGSGPTPLSDANIYYPIQDIVNGAADGTAITTLPNSGTDGSMFDATLVAGSAAPTAATFSGTRVMQAQGYSQNQIGFNLPNTFDVSTNGSLFMVGKSTVTSPAYARAIAFGGQNGSYRACFFGISSESNASSFLLRNTGDGGMSLNGLVATSGLKAFGIIKTGNTIVYFDNSTTAVTWGGSASGTYAFNSVAYRYYNSPFSPQPCTGYLGDMAWYDLAISVSKAQGIMSYLISLYNI